MQQIIKSTNAPAAIGPYSQAVVFHNVVFTSGQLPLNKDTGCIVGKSMDSQTEQAIRNLEAILNAAGSSLSKVIKTTCFITDMKLFGEFNEVYQRFITNTPARSCVAVKELPKGVMVEIEAIASI